MQGDRARKFHDDLLNGLHAVAQPLTVLRAAIEMLARPEAAGQNQKHYLEISEKQVARACDLFASVRELVASSVMQPRLASFELWGLLEPAIEEQTRRQQCSGVGLAVVRPETRQRVTGDADRTEQAFRAALNTALALASHGDVLEIHTARAQGFAEIAVMNARSHGRRLSASDRLAMSLAEVSILSQQGKYRWIDDPFCCWFALPVEEPGQPQPDAQPIH
jgi:hypothetical protein